MLKLKSNSKEKSFYYDKLCILKQLSSTSVVSLKEGNEKIDMYRGNFFIEEEIKRTEDLFFDKIINNENSIEIQFSNNDSKISFFAEEKDGLLAITFPKQFPDNFNRLTIKISATPSEHIYGCGEQFSYFDLRGKAFPLFTGEQGVGRNKETEITKIADREDRAGGDYYTTFYPQSTYISSSNYFLHANTFSYCNFDFSNETYHELTFWEIPESIVIGKAKSLIETTSKLSSYLGKQSPLPSWVYDGFILGVQGGTDKMREVAKLAKDNNLPLSGLWIQDWEGINYTSFGKRLLWDWKWDEKLYPGLPDLINENNKKNIGTLGYINPYVAKDNSLCIEAAKNNYLAKDVNGDDYYVDFGEFYCGIVDFTKDAAYEWFKSVIKKNMIDFGLKGWMADFGEYLPLDCILANGDPKSAHNEWPGLWAKMNYEVTQDYPELLFFMRAGNSMSTKYCRLMWAGDQNVDWSEDDGLPSVITSALSLTLSGMGLHHSDIGGYTSLYGMKRSKQLLIRWTEQATFTSLMRSHESNRPTDNHQIYDDEDTLKKIGYLTRIHVALKKYLVHCDVENSEKGIGVIRPLFFYYEKDEYMSLKDEYLLGEDLLVAPILKEDENSRDVIIPEGNWIHLFTGKSYKEGTYKIDAPLLRPPVFYKKGSDFTTLFETIKKIKK